MQDKQQELNKKVIQAYNEIRLYEFDAITQEQKIDLTNMMDVLIGNPSAKPYVTQAIKSLYEKAEDDTQTCVLLIQLANERVVSGKMDMSRGKEIAEIAMKNDDEDVNEAGVELFETIRKVKEREFYSEQKEVVSPVRNLENFIASNFGKNDLNMK